LEILVFLFLFGLGRVQHSLQTFKYLLKEFCQLLFDSLFPHAKDDVSFIIPGKLLEAKAAKSKKELLVVLGGSGRSEAVQDVWHYLVLFVDSRFSFM
jgi:hypothetical protein